MINIKIRQQSLHGDSKNDAQKQVKLLEHIFKVSTDTFETAQIDKFIGKIYRFSFCLLVCFMKLGIRKTTTEKAVFRKTQCLRM